MYWFYSATIMLILSLIEKGAYRKVVYKLSLFVFFIIISGSYYNGIDWINYVKHYEEIYNNGFPTDYLPYEPGFVFLMYFFASIIKVSNFQIIVLSVSLAFTYTLHLFIKKIDWEFNRSALLLLILLFLLPLFNDAVRQLAAMAVILPFLPRINSISLKKLIVIVLLSSLFHASSILLIPIFLLIRYPLRKRRIIYYALSSVCFVILFVSLPFVISIIGSFIPAIFYAKLTGYVSKLDGGFKFGLFMIIDLVGIIITLLLSEKFKNDKQMVLSTTASFIFFLLHLLFYMTPFLQRLLYYIFPLVGVYSLVSFRVGRFSHLNRMIFPIVAIMCLGVFYRNVTNPYYSYDFDKPKFFYFELLNNDYPNLNDLKSGKCSVIDQFDPTFCPI